MNQQTRIWISELTKIFGMHQSTNIDWKKE